MNKLRRRWIVVGVTLAAVAGIAVSSSPVQATTSTSTSKVLVQAPVHPLRIVALNPLEGWSRDASEDVAQELERRVAEGFEVTEPVREFIERFTGRPIGVQLMLPLREF